MCLSVGGRYILLIMVRSLGKRELLGTNLMNPLHVQAQMHCIDHGHYNYNM